MIVHPSRAAGSLLRIGLDTSSFFSGPGRGLILHGPPRKRLGRWATREVLLMPGCGSMPGRSSSHQWAVQQQALHYAGQWAPCP
ncbi:hypothetical protein Droror1_Dr00027040 [Drosera rotundifolia]